MQKPDYKGYVKKKLTEGFTILGVDDSPTARSVLEDLVGKDRTTVPPPPNRDFTLETPADLAKNPWIVNYLAGRPHTIYMYRTSKELMNGLERSYRHVDAIFLDLNLNENLGAGWITDYGQTYDGVVLAERIRKFFVQHEECAPATFFLSEQPRQTVLKLAREVKIDGGWQKGTPRRAFGEQVTDDHSAIIAAWESGEVAEDTLRHNMGNVLQHKLKQRETKPPSIGGIYLLGNKP